MGSDIDTLNKLVDNLIYWLRERHEITATPIVETRGGHVVELELRDDEGEEFYVGNYGEPGVHIAWLGEFDVGDGEPTYLVRINSLVIEAMGRQIAGWIVGAD
jgi:hypothetical protein